MKHLHLVKSNPGNDLGENYYFNIANSFDGSLIDIKENVINIFSDFYRIESELLLLEQDLLTETYMAHFNDGKKYRIVRPSQQMRSIIGDSISIASMNKSGYAVHYDII